MPASTLRRDRAVGHLDRAEKVIGLIIDVVAAALLAVEIVLLAGTVFARYVLKSPVTWVDEIATLAFLWLGMLGVASALRRGLHMRLTFLLSKFSPHQRARIETLSKVVLLTFLA